MMNSKTIFAGLSVLGLIYLVVQTDVGQTWYNKVTANLNSSSSKSEVQTQPEINIQKLVDILSHENATLKAHVQQLSKEVDTLQKRLKQDSIKQVDVTQVDSKAEKDTKVDTYPLSNKSVSMEQRKLRLKQQAQLQDVITRMEMASINLMN